MNKRILYFFLSVSLIVNAVFIITTLLDTSDSSRLPQGILDVSFDHSEGQLKLDGFKSNYSPNILSKKIGPALVNYTVIHNKGVFDISVVGIDAGGDSLKISEWVKSIGGFICSPFFNLDNKNKKFFVKSFSSGQIFTGIIKDQTIILTLDFPNNDKMHRSSNRIIKGDGEVVIYDSLNDIFVTRNDNVGF